MAASLYINFPEPVTARGEPTESVNCIQMRSPGELLDALDFQYHKDIN